MHSEMCAATLVNCKYDNTLNYACLSLSYCSCLYQLYVLYYILGLNSVCRAMKYCQMTNDNTIIRHRLYVAYHWRVIPGYDSCMSLLYNLILLCYETDCKYYISFA